MATGMHMPANGSFSSFDSPPSPVAVSPTSSFAPRSFVSAIRGQNSPFPTTPTSSMSSFFDPPPGTAYADFIRTWTDAHVARWLTDIKCANHAATFRANDIRGDILLELDQTTLQEMGVSSIGDRLRIINAVKSLRQRSAARAAPSTPILESMRPPRLDMSPDMISIKQERTEASPTTRHRRLESGRPAPLQLNQTSGRNDLPRLVREQQPPESARLNTTSNTSSNNSGSSSNSHPIRPLPQPSQISQSNSSTGTRSNLPPLPPPPRSQPPLPPPGRAPARGILNGGSQLSGRRTPTPDIPSYTAQPLPPAPSQQPLLTPSSASNWAGYHLPADPRPGNAGGGKPPARSTSPLLPGRSAARTINPIHGRNSSLGNNSPGPSSSPAKVPTRSNTGGHPYASSQPSALQAPATNLAYNLSPIEESFNQPSTSGTPSPPSSYSVGRGPFTPSAQGITPSLDDLRRKLVRFLLLEEGLTFTVDVASCIGGIEVLEKVLKKFNKLGPRNPDGSGIDVRETEEGGLSVDGWGVYLDLGQEDGPGEALSEAELLSVCHAPPNHPAREHGLSLRRTGLARGSASPPRSKLLNVGTSKATKRASSISILSGLGVHDPERALDPPSPTSMDGRLSPAPSGPPTPPLASGKKRPSKLHNFFGQRPPSELITDHLTDYFPMTDKKVLARTARQSMIFRANTRSKRDSTASWNPAPSLPSRFSSSTQGSAQRTSTSSPRNSFSSHLQQQQQPPESRPPEDLPRVSLSTEDGRSVDLHSSDGSVSPEAPKLTTHPQLLPPIPFPTESFSESLESITGSGPGARVSRSLSAASRRMSYMTEVRSKRDRTDTASMLTVDEITADLATDRSEDEWTKVESTDGFETDNAETAEITLNDNEVGDELEEDDDLDDADGEGTLNDPDAEDDEPGKSETRQATKWIKGALIGAGSFGKVYLGMDASTGLLMAVKQVELPTGSAPNQERKKSMLSALEREIELLKDLQHENIVQYFYSSLDDDYLNIFLEYVPGGSVTALLRNYGAFEEPLVKNFVRQILEGLNYLHERDIIHRDIKGANILVDNKGGIKISDFGISKKVEDNLMTGNRMHRPSLQGSVFWMAPEVVKQSGHTRKADIWSVGCLVVEMLTGEHPWATLTQMQAIFKIGSSAKPTIPSDISSDAQDFLLLTFELDHEARPSAAELLLHTWVCKKPPGNASKKAPTA
ncbi:ste11-like protein [Mycena belliarum]|uniref:mitogen-activated protein kinase kinase kinase n=1 Tax=Mycena belliarum TaxID=1033014 RepID=A0AAD6XT59_9AGAR|nr:ste11-like protein [Mycena belliae]